MVMAYSIDNECMLWYTNIGIPHLVAGYLMFYFREISF